MQYYFSALLDWLTEPYKGCSRFEYLLASVAGIFLALCIWYCSID